MMNTKWKNLFTLLILETIVLAKSSKMKVPCPSISSEPDSEIADLLYSRGYLPSENDLPKSSVRTNGKANDNDDVYLLSKLTDDDLIKLLSDQTKNNEFDLKDIIRIVLNGNTNAKHNFLIPKEQEPNHTNTNEQLLHSGSKKINSDTKKYPAYFRLEDTPAIDPRNQNNEGDFAALKKLNTLLNKAPQQEFKKEELIKDDERRELLFDVLVAQLKALCCKKPSKRDELLLAKSIVKPNTSNQKPYLSKTKYSQSVKNQEPGEFMFLIINDEIKGRGSNELILVDPESLEKNSSILLLGPITTPLSNGQLTLLMNRISNELSKPEYRTLLQQLSDGTLNENNDSLLKKFIYGPESRRYNKPHRCNHQSKLAKVYGGPKWLICTGYLNLNTPSLYD